MTGLVTSTRVYWMLEPARNEMKAAVKKILPIEFQQSPIGSAPDTNGTHVSSEADSTKILKARQIWES